MKFITSPLIDPTRIYMCNDIFTYDPYANVYITNLLSPLSDPFSDPERDIMTTKKPSTKRIKPNPGVNAVGSTTVQFQLACGCKMEQRFDYKNTTTKRFRKTLLAKIYPEQPSQKDTQVTGTCFYTLVANPKCVTHHPNPKNPLTGLDIEAAGNAKSWIMKPSWTGHIPTFNSIINDILNTRLTDKQKDALTSILDGNAL